MVTMNKPESDPNAGRTTLQFWIVVAIAIILVVAKVLHYVRALK